MTSRLRDDKSTVGLRDDGVVHLRWLPMACLELGDVRTAMGSVNELGAGPLRPLLVEMTEVGTVSHGARTAFATPTLTSRIALLGSSPVDRVLATFRRPGTHPCPTRFFTDQAKALDWLLEEPAPGT